MDEAIDSFERRQRARRYRSARVRRLGDLRRKVVLFSIFTFLALWLIVFGQMASGHDPVLGSKSKSRSGTDTRRAQSKPAPRRPATAQAVDPVTGLVERVPQTGSTAAPAPAPVSPPVVTTSQS
jgi:hypothetical protein